VAKERGTHRQQTAPVNTHVNGGADGNGGISSTAGGVVYDRHKNGKGPSAGPLVPAGNWTPPACWYAPKYTPAQFKAYLEPIWAAPSTGDAWDGTQRDRYVDGKPYKDFNQDKAGKGYWWDSYVNEARIAEPAALACDKPYFWVNTGEPPPADVPEAITPEMLAQLAYAEIRVTPTKVTLAPDGPTKVNLPTWAWLDNADFHPVSVTASVPVLGIQATTTATPVSVRIEPGTADAELHPGSGECPLVNGSIGTPYTAGSADKTPPCGITYLRATGDNGPYKLRATITWKVSWVGTGSPGGNLPDGNFGATQDVTVQEIQAINR
jgi:enoyl reductase